MNITDIILSSNLKVYRNFVEYFNNHIFSSRREEDDTLVNTIDALSKIITRILYLFRDEMTEEEPLGHIESFLKEYIPREFTVFGILVNTGDEDIVHYVLSCSEVRLDYAIPSRYVILDSEKGYGDIDQTGLVPPLIIACRNGFLSLVESMIYWRHETNELMIEFVEPCLSMITDFKNLKIYCFIEKYYSSRYPFYGGKGIFEKTVNFVSMIKYWDLLVHFLELEVTARLCEDYVWKNIFYNSLMLGELRLFCYYVQASLYIDKHLLKKLKTQSTKMGHRKNTILELIYLSGNSLSVHELLRFSDDSSKSNLNYYVHNAASLKHLCRISLRKYFREILFYRMSIFTIIDKLKIPIALRSFLKLEPFIQSHLLDCS